MGIWEKSKDKYRDWKRYYILCPAVNFIIIFVNAKLLFMNAYTQQITDTLNLPAKGIEAVLNLLEEGCTIPFISRYRKEKTGGLSDVEVTEIANLNIKLQELSKRKDTILKAIKNQDKLTPDLEKKISECWDAVQLEDIYLPFKQKRRTRAQVAREQGLEPLATILLLQREQRPLEAAKRFIKDDVKTAADALQGAQDILAEMISEDTKVREIVRKEFQHKAVITSKVVKSKENTDEAQKFHDYFSFSEPLKRCTSHRLLAMRRGEKAGLLRVNIGVDGQDCLSKIHRLYIHGKGACTPFIEKAIEDSFKRLIHPGIENEFAAKSKEQADEEAIKVFAENLRQLLLSAPLGQKRIMALDPGFANGCKMACLDEQGNLLHHEVIFPHPPRAMSDKAAAAILRMIEKYHIEAVAIGNGTASRESEVFVKDCLSISKNDTVKVFIVSEDGASVYSASATAREEFPGEDVTTRGAVSIGRRLMDPLAELVKIDPKSIGVGQYQHDVDQTKLKCSLEQTVESCVNKVGINLNTASKHLLTYVSGLGAVLAQNIVDYRKEHGAFTSRQELKRVPRIGNVAFQQCAGFLRVKGGRNPLDETAVHPESYAIVEQMTKDLNVSVKELIANKSLQKTIILNNYITAEVGLPTLQDILRELDKPGLDPREQLEEFSFDNSVHTIDDLTEGMELPGIVTNITNFGAFVDIGVHQDGLIHISQLADKYISNPTEVVHLHQQVRVRVMEVDIRRKRIGLSMKNVKQ